LWRDAQLFTATWTQCVDNQKDEVASGDLLNAEWSGVKTCTALRKWLILKRFEVVRAATAATFLWDITL
jgi:hypothetical protein